MKFIKATLKYTEDQNKERLSLLGVETDNRLGGIEHFENVDADTLQKLVDKGYASTYDKQNNAPTLGEFLEFMKHYPEFKAHGYVVSNDRKDRRITVEGLKGVATEKEAIWDFKDLCEDADEFECDENGNCFSWWD